MKQTTLDRREFLRAGTNLVLGAATGSLGLLGCGKSERKPVVSVARIRDDRIDVAVEAAIDLLGGIGEITLGKDRIMLKPNLATAAAEDTTHPDVVRALATVLQKAGKEVLIGEGSAAVEGFNILGETTCRTRDREILDRMQKHVFDVLGYTELAKTLGVPLVNLHSGEIVEVAVPGAFVFDTISLHRSLTEIDLLCSVPMMKTHTLATVTLGMKNLIGLYPGTIYDSVRWGMHDRTSVIDPSGTAAAIVDIVRATPCGLVVIDGSTAMEGNGPSVSSGGKRVKMDVIVAGTNPLATDMVASHLMGFEPDEIPTFRWAYQAGMTPRGLNAIEVRCEGTIVRQAFTRPSVVPWAGVRDSFGARVI